MKIRNIILFALPLMALSVGIVALNTPKTSEDYSTVEAADYTPSNRKITFKNDGSVSATFSVNDNVLDSRGWLLCLFTSKPAFDPVTHKIDNSSNLHPYSTAACAHYFFASNETREGNISVTWNADFADQKEEGKWSEYESTGGTNTLATCLNSETDWYIVVGIRHYRTGWQTHGSYPGGGTNGWWENADYYAGRKSNIKNNYPYGEIYLDLTEFTNWENDGAKFSVYFFGANDKKAFSNFAVSVPNQDHIWIASYELDFNPTGMIGVRYKSTSTTPNWGDATNQTQDLTFHRYGVIGVKSWDKWEDNGWSDFLATVKIDGVTDEIVLDNYKRNDQNQSEHYNDYIDLKANDKFVIKYHSSEGFTPKDFYSMDCLDILKVKDKEYFEIDETNHEIKVLKSGTYSFYFKADVNNGQVFISKPEIAFADVWAKSFLEGTGEDTSCELTKTNWSSHEDEYDSLPHSAKTFLLNLDHEPDPNVKFDNYFARAIQRYDYIIYLYGTSTYNDYIGRVNAGRFTPRSTFNPIIGAFSSDNSTPIALVVIISVASLTAVGGYIFLKRRKEN